jgi:hypothetical protein
MTKRAATRCGPNSIRATSQAHPAGQEGLAYTLGGRILQAASSVGCAVEGFSDPRGYFIGEILHWSRAKPPAIRRRTSGQA